MLNIVIPMAGRGSRFAQVGYKVPKPLIDIYGHSMIEYVIRNLTPSVAHRFVFICQKEHLKKYNLLCVLQSFAPNCIVLTVDKVTDGAACTVLVAEHYIDNDDELMIANSDQYVDIDINLYLAQLKQMDGLIMTMPASDSKWSYIKYDANGLVTMVREKEVISNQATVGIYNYKRGSDFVKFAHQMITKNIRVNNEFYVAPVYNEMIASGKKLRYFDIGDKMHGLGTPDDLKKFMGTDLSKEIFNENY